MKVAIVSTSINARPLAYEQWAEYGDLFIAGDRNAPISLETYVRSLGGMYIRPGLQDQWAFSDTIGWNCIQRRNAAVMEAYAAGDYDYIMTVDDDNVPTGHSFMLRHLDIMSRGASEELFSSAGWVNIGDFVVPNVNQRGHPLWFMHKYTTKALIHPEPIVVSQAPIVGIPDCDAVTRITTNPSVDHASRDVVVSNSCYAPFNSQATIWQRDWAPLIACLPGVGRYDDIFASFIAQRLMRVRKVHLHVGGPAVFQDRNPHDYMKDLQNELFGMKHTYEVTNRLDHVVLPADVDLPTMYRACALALMGLLPHQTIRFMEEWADDWERSS